LLVLLLAVVVGMFRRGLVDGGDARLLHVHLALQELGQLGAKNPSPTESTRSVPSAATSAQNTAP